jgi:hypothetical protein
LCVREISKVINGRGLLETAYRQAGSDLNAPCGCPERSDMTTMNDRVTDYLEWIKVNNFATTTMANRGR